MTSPSEKEIEMLKRIEESFFGPKTKGILRESLKYEALSNIYFGVFECPPVICKGKNYIINDADGKEYIDFLSGFSALNVGHCNPEVVRAIKDQTKKIMMWGALPNDLRVKLAKKMTEITPGDFEKKVHFLTTGGEAVELALRVAKFYKSRPLIISFYGGYHGATRGTLSSTTSVSYRHYERFYSMNGFVHVPHAYCYRCFFGKEYPDCEMECTKYIERLLSTPRCGLKTEEINEVAAILLEPMLGSMGYFAPPKEFLSEIRRIADEHDLLLIVDEVQTGWGRTGKFFACEHSNVTPDILVTGKAIAGGIPLSVVVGKAQIMDSIGPPGYMSTFGGTPLACAAALATIEIIEKEKLLERSEKMGNFYLKRLNELYQKHEMIGNISGKGLYIGIELVKNRKTKEPAIMENLALQNECMKRGLIYEKGGMYGNIIKIICPLTVEKGTLDKSIDILDESLSFVEKQHS